VADVLVLTDPDHPDHPDYARQCGICGTSLGTTPDQDPRPVARLTTGLVHVACLRAPVTTGEMTP